MTLSMLSTPSSLDFTNSYFTNGPDQEGCCRESENHIPLQLFLRLRTKTVQSIPTQKRAKSKKNTTHKHSNFNFPRSKVRLLLQSTPMFTEFPQVSITFSNYEVIGSTPCSAYSVFSNFIQTSIRILLIGMS